MKMSQESRKGRSKVRGAAAGVGQRSGSKRFRGSCDNHEREQSHEVDLDPDYLLDKLLGSLSNDDSLLERFIQYLFQMRGIQSKITEQMTTAATVAASAATANISDSIEETVSVNRATTLAHSMEKLAVAVSKLNSDLVSSNQKCDDLEQYSRRNNIIISNVPVKDSSTLETQVCNILNDYVTPPLEPTDIEHTHRIYRKASKATSDRPPDIIVKFQIYRSWATVLTKETMVTLKEMNDRQPDKNKIYISEDLTKIRKEFFFYKSHTLKKKGYLKSTLTRDGKIIANIDDNNRCFFTSQSDLEAMCTKFKMPVPQLRNQAKTKPPQSSGDAMEFESIPFQMTQGAPKY